MRPFTLLEVSERVRRSANSVKEFSEFLDHFYDRNTKVEMFACLSDEPIALDDPRLNALYAASADYLAKRYRLTSTPKWVFDPKRYLDEPWFSTDEESLREYLTFTSPAEFRTRNIYTEAVPLRRARTWQAEQRATKWLSEMMDYSDSILSLGRR